MRPIYGSDGKPIYAYRKGPPGKRQAAGKAAKDAGHAFQVSIASYLTHALPPEYIWTASAMGVNLPMKTAGDLKAVGGKRGWPDYAILFPSAATRYLEAKSGTASLSPEQKAFRAACDATGRDIYAEVRSLEDVESALLRWKVPVRCSIGQANRYVVERRG